MLSDPAPRRQDTACGRHSGIPLCCIAFYVGPWRWAIRQRWMNAFAYHRWRDLSGYVQCPACKWLRRPRRTLAECSCWFGPSTADEWAKALTRWRAS